MKGWNLSSCSRASTERRRPARPARPARVAALACAVLGTLALACGDPEAPNIRPAVSIQALFEQADLPSEIIAAKEQMINEAASDTLEGFACSPGQVTAEASVILSPADFDKMKPSSILVCPMTTPAWTHLFSQATGLVTDVGGILSHGSIVAREYDIPAVLGTGDITQRIVSGQKISVDGTKGTVTILDS